MTSPQPPAPNTHRITRQPPQTASSAGAGWTAQSASPRMPPQHERQKERSRPHQPGRDGWWSCLTRMKLPGIRWQLTLWYTAMFTVVLLLAAGVAYGALKVTLDWRVDEALQSQAQRLAAGISDEQGTITVRNVTGSLPGLPVPANTGGNGSTPPTGGQLDDGTLVRVLTTQGQVVYSSPAFRGILLPTASVTTPLSGKTWTDTIRVRDVEVARFYSQPLVNAQGQVYAVLQVGQSLDLLTTTLGVSALILAILLPLLLVVTAVGSYILAGWAFAPVRRLTRIARGVGGQANDLHRRAPVPRAHDEVRELALTLNEMLARLEAAFAAQRRFIADASHDLRTPVAAILSVAENARDQVAGQVPGQVNGLESLGALGDIAIQAQRLGHLLTNLLALARADEGQLRLEREPLRLDQLAQEVVVSLRPLAEERGLILTTGPLTPAIVQGDLAQLLLVLMNLVDNALTYTPRGGRVTVSVRSTPTHASVQVQDTGIGIAAAEVPHVFERFYRADSARQRSTGGSGLGLAIVQTLVEAHEGTVEVTSSVGIGSCFVATLPHSDGLSHQRRPS